MVRKNTKLVRRKVRLGFVHADDITFAGALDDIASRIAAKVGGYVVTPNVDHVCLAEEMLPLRHAYADAALSLVDGTLLFWLARFLGTPLPEKISGSDLIWPLMERAAANGWRVYLLGGAEGVGIQAGAAMQRRLPNLNIVGADAPAVGFEERSQDNETVLARIHEHAPDLLLVALGCPKQELWMQAYAARYAPAVAIGIGATLDFVAGRVRRAPPWVSSIGMEWLYRLVQEPRRLAHRYLVRDLAIVGVAVRMWRRAPAERTFFK